MVCVKKSQICDKQVADLSEIWENFDLKNGKIFPSKLFKLTKTKQNSEFFNTFTSNQEENMYLYVERKDKDIKKFLNPLLSS